MPTLRIVNVLVLLLFYGVLAGQGPDCVQALVVCDGGAINFTPTGSGDDDFDNPNNNDGCLAGENSTAWFYFEFHPSMPPDQVIEFVVDPFGGPSEDYDFALFGPNVECDNLGSPIRCSWAEIGLPTGLGNGATDVSEGDNGDSFVAPLTVQPGQGYYLMLDNYFGNSTGFNLTWGGTAAGFLTCDVDCDMTVDAGPAIDVCADGTLIMLPGSAQDFTGTPTYTWTASNNGLDFLDNPNIAQPNLTFPSGTSGTFTYILSVEDDICIVTASVEVTVNPAPEPVILGDPGFCAGGTITLDAGAGYTDYLWSNNAITQTITTNAGGIIGVTVTDAAGCMGTATTNIDVYPLPDPTITGSTSICAGEATILDAGAGYVSYLWTDNTNLQEFTANAAGTYGVTVTDGNGCEGSTSAAVTSSAELEVTIGGDAVVCTGGTATIDAGPGFTSYLWSDASENQTLTVSNGGPYSVTVTNASGCMGIGTIDLPTATPPDVTITGGPEICAGTSITLDAGAGFANYLWSDNSNAQLLTIDTPGEYTVAVTDGQGCSASASVMITETSLSPTITGDVVFCEGDQTVLDAGAGYASYLWSDANATATRTLAVDQPGDYSVTVTDASGCQGISTLTILTITPQQINIQGELRICNGESTLLSSETSFESYLWSDGSETPDIEVVVPGEYSVLAIDDNGCTATDTVQVTGSGIAGPNISGPTELCLGDSITLQADPGFTNYNWSNGLSGPEIQVVVGGSLTLVVSDDSGCSDSTSIFLTELTPPMPVITGTDVICVGDTAVLDAGPGYASYAWSLDTDEQTLAVGLPGNFRVTVTDAQGCVGTTNFSVTERALPEPQIEGNTPFCPSDSILLSVAETFETYLWSNGAAVDSTQVRTAGTYEIVVTDEFGCAGSDEVLVETHTVPDLQIAGTLGFCADEETTLTAVGNFVAFQWSRGDTTQAIMATDPGLYTVSATTGEGCSTETSVELTNLVAVPPTVTGEREFCAGEAVTLTAESGYSDYRWSDNTMGSTAVFAEPGTYTLTANDANGCEVMTTVVLTEHAAPEVSIGGSTSFCSGSSTVLNAGGSYTTYLWSDNTVEPTLEVATAGNYGLTVTNENGCTGMAEVAITEASQLNPVITGALRFCENGETTLDAGTGFASYVWSDGSEAQTLIVADPGTYSVEVSDGNGCSGTQSVEVLEDALPTVAISGTTAFCPGATTTLDAGPDFVSYLWSNGAVEQQVAVASAEMIGVAVTDANGCVGTDSIAITESPVPSVEILGTPFFCENGSTQLSVSDEYASYTWSNADQDASTEVSEADTYTVVVTNEFGCAGEASLLVEEVELPTITVPEQEDIDCQDPAVALLLENNPTLEEYTYFWMGPGIAEDAVNEVSPVVTIPGNYEVILTNNEFGCELAPVALTINASNELPTANVAIPEIINCNRQEVILDGSASSSGQTIVYQWFGPGDQPIAGATQNTFTAATAGNYQLMVQDTLTGCMAQATTAVMQDDDLPMAEAGPTQLLDCATTSVSLDGSASIMGAEYDYQWSALTGSIDAGADTLVATISTPGLYLLQVINTNNGCTGTDTVTVLQDVVLPVVNAGEPQSLDCQTTEVILNGSNSSTGNGFTYQWLLNDVPIADAAAQTLTLPTDTVGRYTLVVTDQSNGCINADEVMVLEDEQRIQGITANADNPTCFGDTDGEIRVAEVQGGQGPYLYSLNGEPFSTSAVFPQLIGGTYRLVVQDMAGCEYETAIELADGNDLQLELGDDLVVDLGTEVAIDPILSVPESEVETFIWKGLDSLNCIDCVEFTAMEFTVLTATVTDINGCTVSDQLQIFVRKDREVFIPNVFSPNGDGQNDVFLIFAGNDVAKINALRIFDRWGQMVFQNTDFLPNDATQGWDGKLRTQTYNAAVFTYQAEIEFIDGEVVLFKGDVTLLR